MRPSHVVAAAALVFAFTLCAPAGAGNGGPSIGADPLNGPAGTLVTFVGSCGSDAGLVGETFLPVFFHQGASTVALTPGIGAVDGNFGPEAATVAVPAEAQAGAARFEVQCPEQVGSLFVDFTVTSPSVPPAAAPLPVTAAPTFTG
jgi:hypothetical protein